MRGCIGGWRQSVEGPTMPAWAVTRGAQRLRPRPRSPRLHRVSRWGPPRPWQLGDKATCDDGACHFSHYAAAHFSQTSPSSQSSPPPSSSSSLQQWRPRRTPPPRRTRHRRRPASLQRRQGAQSLHRRCRSRALAQEESTRCATSPARSPTSTAPRA